MFFELRISARISLSFNLSISLSFCCLCGNRACDNSASCKERYGKDRCENTGPALLIAHYLNESFFKISLFSCK